MTDGSIIIDTPDGIAFFRLAALKGALSMQAGFGMQLSRGRSATAIAKSDYGLKGQAKTMLPIVEKQVEDLTYLRSWDAEALAFAQRNLSELDNALQEQGREYNDREVYSAIAEAKERDALPDDVCDLLIATYRVLQFESRCKPSARVLTNDGGRRVQA